MIVTFISQILNALGIGLAQSVGGFLIGVYRILRVSGLNFVFLLYFLGRALEDAPAP